MGLIFSCCCTSAVTEQFLAKHRSQHAGQGGADSGLWQFRVDFPRWRFYTYLLLTVLQLGLGGYCMTSDTIFGHWFFVTGFATLCLAFYYPVVVCFTSEHFAMRMKLLQLLCINHGWLVFNKRSVLSITDEYRDHTALGMCNNCTRMLCFGFEDWADLDNNPYQKTLTLEMDDGFAWGKYVTVKMAPPAPLKQVQEKSGVAIAGTYGNSQPRSGPAARNDNFRAAGVARMGNMNSHGEEVL
jgi:hypothetical protein|eukprot:g7592.t1